MKKEVGKKRFIASWILTIVLSLFIIISGVFVFLGADVVDNHFNTFGLERMQPLIGIGMFVSAALFLIPSTFVIGSLFLTAFWGGAIVTHMSVGSPYAFQSIMLLLIWVALILRRDDLFRQ